MRGAVGMQQKEPARFIDFCTAMFKSIWIDALNMNDATVIASTLSQAGFDPLTVLAMTNDSTIKDALKANTQEAVDRGVFGAPTFFVEHQMFWGQDRLDFVKEALL